MRPLPAIAAPLLLLGAVLARAAAPASEPERLERGNYRSVGAALVDLLEACGVTLAAMTLGLDAGGAPTLQAAGFAPGSRRPAGRETVERTPCPGGGHVTVSVSDADGDEAFSRGDRVETRFEDCRLEGKAVGGSSRFVVARHRVDAARELTTLDFEFRDFGTQELHWSGRAQAESTTLLATGAEHDVIRYEDLQVSLGGRRMQWSFVLDVQRGPLGGQVASFDGPLRLGALGLVLQQDEPFAIDGQGRPRAGQLSARDARGARLEVSAQPEGYAYRYSDPAGSAAAPAAATAPAAR